MENQCAVLVERIDALIKTVAEQQEQINNLSREVGNLKTHVNFLEVQVK